MRYTAAGHTIGTQVGHELETEIEHIERNSCLSVHVHMPYKEGYDESWFKDGQEVWGNREQQNVGQLHDILKSVFFPIDQHSDACATISHLIEGTERILSSMG